mgnify:CR=1 FL=1
MNAFYNWTNDEIVITERMKDIQCEIDSIHLLHDAGLFEPGLYERTVISFGNILVRLGQRLQEKYSHSHQAYQTTSGKYAV